MERSLVGLGHILYASISGCYLGLAKINLTNFGPIVVKGMLLAALVHATYGTIVTYTNVAALLFVVFLVVDDGSALYYILQRLVRYRRIYRTSVL